MARFIHRLSHASEASGGLSTKERAERQWEGIEPILGTRWAEGLSISQGTLRMFMINNEKVFEASITNRTLFESLLPIGFLNQAISG